MIKKMQLRQKNSKSIRENLAWFFVLVCFSIESHAIDSASSDVSRGKGIPREVQVVVNATCDDYLEDLRLVLAASSEGKPYDISAVDGAAARLTVISAYAIGINAGLIGMPSVPSISIIIQEACKQRGSNEAGVMFVLDEKSIKIDPSAADGFASDEGKKIVQFMSETIGRFFIPPVDRLTGKEAADLNAIWTHNLMSTMASEHPTAVSAKMKIAAEKNIKEIEAGLYSRGFGDRVKRFDYLTGLPRIYLWGRYMRDHPPRPDKDGTLMFEFVPTQDQWLTTWLNAEAEMLQEFPDASVVEIMNALYDSRKTSSFFAPDKLSN